MKKHWLGSIALILCLSAAISARVHADEVLSDLPTVNKSLTLKDALAQAMTSNLSLHQAHSDAQAASAMARSASAQTKPSVSTTTYALVSASANIVASSPGIMPQNFFGTPAKGTVDQNVFVMAPLFTGGKLRGQVESAQAQSNAAQFSSDATKLMVQQTVVMAYTKVLTQQALVDVAQARLSAEDEQIRVTQEKVNTGRLAPADLLREQAEQADAQQAVLEAKNNQAQALIDLKVALGISQGSEITVADTLDTLTLPVAIPTSLQTALQQAEHQRPDLSASLQQISSARANVESAKATYSPQVYAIGMADGTAIINGGSRAGYTVGLTASLPLYDGGQRRADVDAAKARLDRAIADAQNARQTVDQQVASTWLNLQTATQQVVTAQIGVTTAQKAYDLATMRYNAGKSVAAERLDALAALTRAQGALAQAKGSIINAQITIVTAMGLSI